MNRTIEEFLAQDERKGMLRVLTAGSVDDGKSTLIGRLLFDSKHLYEDQLQALRRDSERVGNAGQNIDYALLCDGLKAEREQGITIDVAYRYFATSRRKFIIADTPGHEQYTRNMITGGSTAELAIILVDARQGIMTQTRRHTMLVHLLGIRHIVLAVNKMDAVGYSQSRFNTITAHYRQWLDSQDITFPDLQCIPISALHGDNVVERSENMPWYSGATLLSHLEGVDVEHSAVQSPFRFPVQYVLRPNQDFRGFAGKIASGVVRVGDKVVAHPSGISSTIKSIVTYDGNLDYAFAPQSVVLTLADQIDLSRGEMLSLATEPQPLTGHTLTATVVWMDTEPLDGGKLFYIKQGTNTLRAKIVSIAHRIDINTGAKLSASTLSLNEIACVTISCTSPIICDPYSANRQTGAFIVIDPITNFTSAVGMVIGVESGNSCPCESISLSIAQCGIGAEHLGAITAFCRHLSRECGVKIECRE
ncbi:MAG: sulfate adenylyltransferase subunit CysN [Alistipes sp.]|nr:sulfate adenylyltransferase subunit CysN [Alistipes sp.]